MTKAQRPTIFIVDDEPAVRESHVLLLDVRGLKAESYADSKAFLTAYDGSRPAAFCSIFGCRK